MSRAVTLLLALAALAGTAPTLRAQAPAPPTAVADTVKPLKATAALSFLSSGGNSEVTSLTVNERVEWKRPRYIWAQSANAVDGTTDGKKTANLLELGLRGDWTPPGRLSVYSLASYDRNRFAQIDHRTQEGLGLAYRLVENVRHRLTTELGTQFVQQKNLVGEINFIAGRAAEAYRYAFKDGAYLEERLEFLPNLEKREDYRTNFEGVLVAPLSRKFGLKVGYALRYDNLPEPNVKKTDRFATAGLQVTF